MRKGVLILVFVVLSVLTIAMSSAEKLDVIPVKDIFSSGENIALRVSLLDSSNNPIDANVEIVAEDALKKISVGKTVQTNTPVELDLGENSPSGYWKLSAKYIPQNGEPLESSAIFMVEVNELARFEIKDNVLTVVNAGNTKYAKTLQIVIGDSIGSKKLDLGVGESTSFKLIAPDGVYNIRVTDGKTTISQPGVSLTGNVIGILDNEERAKSPLTTAVNGETPAYGEDKPSSLFKSRSFVYLFLLALVVASILLAIERRARAKAFAN